MSISNCDGLKQLKRMLLKAENTPAVVARRLGYTSVQFSVCYSKKITGIALMNTGIQINQIIPISACLIDRRCRIGWTFLPERAAEAALHGDRPLHYRSLYTLPFPFFFQTVKCMLSDTIRPLGEVAKQYASTFRCFPLFR